MTKIVAPLGSFSASGMIGPRLVFSNRKSGQQVRFQRAQKDFDTPARDVARSNYGEGIFFWRNLSVEEKESFKIRAVGQNISGYNLFMKEFLLGIYIPGEIGDFILRSYTPPSGDSVDFELQLMT